MSEVPLYPPPSPPEINTQIKWHRVCGCCAERRLCARTRLFSPHAFVFDLCIHEKEIGVCKPAPGSAPYSQLIPCAALIHGTSNQAQAQGQQGQGQQSPAVSPMPASTPDHTLSCHLIFNPERLNP